MKQFIEKHTKEIDGKTGVKYLYPYKAEKAKPPPYAEGVEMIEVPEQPDGYYIYNGTEWVEDTDKIASVEAKQAKQELEVIDEKSIRSIREYIYAVENEDDVLKAEALKYLEQEELEARKEREKVK